VTAHLGQHGDDRTWHILAELADGGVASVEITAGVHAEWAEGADVYGERGSVRLRTHFPFARRASEVEVYDEATGLAERGVYPDTDAYQRQLEGFVASIRTGAPARPSVADGVAAVRLIEAVAASVDGGGSRQRLAPR
jgi:predicted dehydrogenase